MKPLILGNGLLGTELAHQTGWDCCTRDKDGFDILQPADFERYLWDHDTIINCIGFTKDHANKPKNLSVNFEGVIYLADYCRETGKRLVQISTDIVYCYSPSQASEEDVPVHAGNWYAFSKVLADGYIQTMCDNYLIIRTAFKPRPFPYPVAFDKCGNFDYVDTIAGLIIELVKARADGIVNVGTHFKTMLTHAKETKPDIQLDKRYPLVDVSMNLSKMLRYLAWDNENKIIRSLLPDKGVMIDAGAHTGQSFRPFIGWQIYAYEPDPEIASRIPLYTGVTVIKKALSDIPSKSKPFYKTYESKGMSSLLAFRPSHKHAFDVEVITLDDEIDRLGIDQVDYLKTDVEGYDLMVLKGFPWEKIRPSIVMSEFGNSKTELLGYTHDDLAMFMIDRDYKVIVSEWVQAPYVNGRYQHKWLGFYRYPCPKRILWWGNMIFFENDKLYEKFCRKVGL